MSLKNRHNGVGLRFDNYPNDLKKFYWVLAKEGCHPKAADRILDRIRVKGYDLLTVMSHLNFDWIIRELSTIGVVVTLIEPLEGWVGYKFDDGAWPQEVLDEVFKNRNIRNL